MQQASFLKSSSKVSERIMRSDVLAFEVLRALNRGILEDVERFASRVDAGRELHAHAVDGGDEHRSDVVARYVYLARAYRVGLRAAAARHADDLRLEPLGLIEALHLGDSEGPEAEAAVVADDYLLAVCGLLLPRLGAPRSKVFSSLCIFSFYRNLQKALWFFAAA